ncbi:MAG: hypothetical protein ACFE96_11055 [Candidatus Hermodarchaeota archaeon]
MNFDKEEISSLQFDYAKVNFRPEQLKLVTMISNLICEQIAIPKLAMRGTAWYAMREWQRKENKLVSDIASMSMTHRLSATKQIFNIGKEKLKQMLSFPKEQSEALLDICFERAFKYYLEHLYRMQK